jgi:hypothetical protein
MSDSSIEIDKKDNDAIVISHEEAISEIDKKDNDAVVSHENKRFKKANGKYK